MKRYFWVTAHSLLVLSLCFCYKGTAHALWENKGLYGGQIQTLVISSKNPDLIFAGSWSGDGFFKSSDGGATWESCAYFRNSEVFSIVIGGEDQKTIWVAHSMFLAKSSDEGRSWKRSFSAEKEGRFCCSVAIHPHDDNTVYLGCGGPGAGEKGDSVAGPLTVLQKFRVLNEEAFDTQKRVLLVNAPGSLPVLASQAATAFAHVGSGVSSVPLSCSLRASIKWCLFETRAPGCSDALCRR